MRSSQVGGALVIVLAAVSIDGPRARSQGGSGSGSEVVEAGSDDDDPGSGSNNGSGSTLVAPGDPTARQAWLRDRFAALVTARPTLARARLGFHVVDLSTGKELLSKEGDRGLNLASNTKLLTAVAALSGLGGGFRWRTGVFCAPPDADGKVAGDLYIRGRGDPVLSVDGLRALAKEVAARGVREVEGKLVVDTSYFDNITEPPHFDEQPKERAAFRAPIASFAVNRSAYEVVVMAEPAGAASITIEPPLPEYLKLTKTEVTSTREGRTRLRLDAKVKPNAIELDVTGTIRGGGGTWDLRRRVDDPARFAAEVFRRALSDYGIRLRTRTIAYGPVPMIGVKQIAVHDSPTLADVMRSMNKHSDNNVAEAVLKTLGAELKPVPGNGATWAQGITAMRTQLGKLGVIGTFRVENGSGLYASTEVSPKQLVGLLVAAHKDYRIGPDLVASLPVGGSDGTLARRWHNKPARGRVRAKTGTLDKVSSLAGYIGVDGGHLLAFAILANDIPAGQRAVVRAMADEMVDTLAAYLDAR
ncbi:MAG: D-alanyl-D-alanine carboxypeptidase/D-alanyl-D-alanine-endopeptidase [Kofleriaceae bacterium]